MAKYSTKEIETLVAQAEESFVKQEYEHSIEILHSIIAEKPDYAPAYRKLSAISLRTQAPAEALPLINKALELVPDDPENWKMMGHYNVRFRLWDKALEAFRRSLELSGENPQTEYEIAKVYRSMKDNDRLLAALTKLAERYPDNITFGHEYAMQLLVKGDDRKALETYERLMKFSIDQLSSSIINEWRKLMGKFGRIDKVLNWLKQQSESYPDSAMLKWLLSAAYLDNLESEKAEKLLLQAHAIDPKNTEFLYTLAYVFYSRGKKEDALFYYNKCLDLDSVNPKALRIASTLHKFSHGDKLFTHLNRAAVSLLDMTVEDQAEMHYALGKAFDDAGELDVAFLHYKKGGFLHSHGKRNDLKKFTIHSNHQRKFFDRSFFEAHKGQGYQSSKPIFILGMIRSGTTLTEGVLSSLQGVTGAGELDYVEQSLNQISIGGLSIISDRSTLIDKNADFRKRGAYYLSKIENLAPEGTLRIIDKMPDNFKYAGWIPLILPEASIIHTRRHPVEICLSAYRIMFPEGHYWSDDLQTMGRYYRHYHDLMQHWKNVLPDGTILDVRYEDMVNDLETESKRLAAHIGVEWDPACLEFHKSSKQVRTASAMQVRQPIYKSSTNRWRKYEPYLQPLLDEIGDLVKAYETELTKEKPSH